MFDRLVRWRAALEDARESTSSAGKGCGCLFCALLGSMCGMPLFAGTYGDYIGPPEGIGEYGRTKERLVIDAFVWFGVWATAGSWLVSPRRRR